MFTQGERRIIIQYLERRNKSELRYHLSGQSADSRRCLPRASFSRNAEWLTAPLDSVIKHPDLQLSINLNMILSFSYYY